MRSGHLCLNLAFVAIAATVGGCAVDGSSDEQTSDQELAAKPDATAYVLTVRGIESIRVTGAGQNDLCDGGPCAYPFLAGTALTLQAIGNTADCLTFASWTGACAGQPATCHIAINSDLSITASFKGISGCRPK